MYTCSNKPGTALQAPPGAGESLGHGAQRQHLIHLQTPLLRKVNTTQLKKPVKRIDWRSWKAYCSIGDD